MSLNNKIKAYKISSILFFFTLCVTFHIGIFLVNPDVYEGPIPNIPLFFSLRGLLLRYR